MTPYKTTGLVQLVGLVAAVACAVAASSCSGAGGASSDAVIRHTGVSRPIPGVRVELSPMLDGGSAGWCIVGVSASTPKKGNEIGSCGGVRTSTGPIFYENCQGGRGGKHNATVVVLTRGEVAFVTVAGGRPIPTESNSTLEGGLRAVAIELPGYRIVAKPFSASDPWSPCPRVTALEANARPIDEQGRSGAPFTVFLPRRRWYRPEHQPSGVCQLTATRLPRETVPIEGAVTTRIGPVPGLVGQAFISCANTTYFYKNEHDLTAAVLLDAAHPGAVPSELPGIKPLAGHPSVFVAPSHLFARHIPGAWLVVGDEDDVGPSVPVELLEHLRATVHL
jgi:hypothetical protein